MNEPTITQTVLFGDLADRPLVATFDQPHASSDGGAILLNAADVRGVLTTPGPFAGGAQDVGWFLDSIKAAIGSTGKSSPATTELLQADDAALRAEVLGTEYLGTRTANATGSQQQPTTRLGRKRSGRVRGG